MKAFGSGGRVTALFLSGISSDVEITVVAQFLSELDGLESLENVIVIGASNRQDLIEFLVKE